MVSFRFVAEIMIREMEDGKGEHFLLSNSKIILTEAMPRLNADGETNHLTLANELKDPIRLLKHTSHYITLNLICGAASATIFTVTLLLRGS